MALGSLLAGLGGAVRSLGIRQAAIASAKFVATKVVLTTLLVSGLAIVLHNFVISFMTDFINASAQEMTDGNMQSFLINLEGIGAYIGNKLKLQESISLILSGVSVGAVRKFIPFIG